MNKFSIKESELFPVHVLIVDDDRSLGEMLVNFISKCTGFHCFYCDSARTALQVLEERVLDVVVTDIKMPDMNGLELTRIIKEKYGSGVIVITGFNEDFTYEQAIECGANDFIEKPVRPTELIIRLKRILRERATLSVLQRRIQELEQAQKKCKLVQEELQYQNEMLQTILDNIPVMVALFNRVGQYQLINSCWQSTLGWSLEELRQHKDIFAELYPDPKYREYVLGYIKMAEGIWNDFKTRTRRGHVLDTSWVNVSLSDGSNIGIGIDISDRKRTETALRESEERYRHIVETSMEGIWIINEEFQTIFVNKRIADMLGYAPEEMLRRRVDSFMFEEDLADYASRVDARRRGVGEVFERRFSRKDGTTIWNIVSSSPLFDGNGRFTGSFSMFTDITKRKQTESDLRESEEKYRSLASTVDSLVLVDRDCRYLFANKNYMDRFGPIRESVFGRKYDEFHSEETSRIFADAVKHVYDTGNPYQDEWVGRRSGNCSLRTFSPVKNTVGRITAVTVVAKDITDRKRIDEELLSKSNALEELNTALKVLMAHYKNDQKELEARMVSNIRGRIIPYIERLKGTGLDNGQAAFIEIIERSFNDISSPFLKLISSEHFRFTPTEVEVVSLIKEGKTTKEIAQILGIGKRTADSHRDNIRGKLGLANKKVNLRTYLLSIDNT